MLEIMEGSIEAYCPHQENLNNEVCKECKPNLEGTILFAFSGIQGGAKAIEKRSKRIYFTYDCPRRTTFSRDKIAKYGEQIIFEE